MSTKQSVLNGSRETLATIDWISTTAHNSRLTREYASHPSLHDWENWHSCSPRNGYTTAVKHVFGVVAMDNLDRPDMGIHTIYSGSALARMDEAMSINGLEVLKYHVDNGHNVARLDIAIDFVNTGVTVQDFQNAYILRECKTRLKTATTVQSVSHDGHTFYIGSQKARKKLVRIYDKAAEQGMDKADWVRMELQLMGKPATKAGIRIINEFNAETMVAIMKSVTDFPTVPQWKEVSDGLVPIKIGSQSSEKGDTRRWLENQCIPALAKEVVASMDYWIQFKAKLDFAVVNLYADRDKGKDE